MPISIPTSIAGISVPGAINGPLQALYGNKYDRATYNYPRNLGSDATRSHVIKFTSMKPNPAPEVQSQLGTNAVGIAEGGIQLGASILNGTDTGTAVSKIQKNVDQFVSDVSRADVPRIPDKSIALYIPDTVNVSYGASYDDISLTESLGKAYFLAQAGTSMIDMFKGNGDKGLTNLANAAGADPFVRSTLANLAGKVLGASNLGDLALRGIGQAMNPQLQVLFRGIGFRSFQFDFVFTPFSKEETETVRNIIKAFKFAAAPNIKPTKYFSQGLFMEVPYPFEIQFFYKGKENPYVHRIGQCVLENINVDYGPNGWATFNDGSPVQIKMTLQFKETVIVDKNRIEAGY
jgi:hypothetical protein